MPQSSTKGRHGTFLTRQEFLWEEWLSYVQLTCEESTNQPMTKQKQILAMFVWLLMQQTYLSRAVRWNKSCTDITLNTLVVWKNTICAVLSKRIHTELFIVQSKGWFRRTTFANKFYLKGWLCTTVRSTPSTLKCFLSSLSRNLWTSTITLAWTKWPTRSTFRLNSNLTRASDPKSLLV